MIYAIIQARMNSSRLPGKVLLNICGLPELAHVVRRVREAKNVDKVILATTNTNNDDAIEQCCIENNISCFRGSENDVLDRYFKAAQWVGVKEGDYVVRVTADCPFIDAEVIDIVVEAALKSKCDYVSNTINPTFPDGLDVEVFTFKALKVAWESARLLSEREHVTPFLYNHTEMFQTLNVECESDYSNLRWTLDEKEDFEVINKVYEELYREDRLFNMEDVLLLYKNRPEIFVKNSRYNRNEGYEKSLQQDYKSGAY